MEITATFRAWSQPNFKSFFEICGIEQSDYGSSSVQIIEWTGTISADALLKCFEHYDIMIHKSSYGGKIIYLDKIGGRFKVS